jgi:hypothetical protein
MPCFGHVIRLTNQQNVVVIFRHYKMEQELGEESI